MKIRYTLIVLIAISCFSNAYAYFKMVEKKLSILDERFESDSYRACYLNLFFKKCKKCDFEEFKTWYEKELLKEAYLSADAQAKATEEAHEYEERNW